MQTRVANRAGGADPRTLTPPKQLENHIGRNQLKKPNQERFSPVTTPADSLAGRTDGILSGKAGLVFYPVECSFFQNLDGEIRDLIQVSGRQTNAHHEVKDDRFGTRWVLVEDPDFEDLVSTVHLVAETIPDHGFGDRLIAAVFGLSYDGQRAYWIYHYKSGRFYPFVQSGAQQRDNNVEMRLGVVMESEQLNCRCRKVWNNGTPSGVSRSSPPGPALHVRVIEW